MLKTKESVQRNTQDSWAVLSKSSAPLAFALLPRSPTLSPSLPPSYPHLCPGRLLDNRLLTLTPQNIFCVCVHVCCERAAWSLPTVCSKCVEPSVSKTGRPWFPFSPGLVSLFSGASLLPVWLLGLGQQPHRGLLQVAEQRLRLSGPSAAALRAIHY